MWTLVLTIFMFGSDGSQMAAVDHVDGFDTYQACMAAGKQWGDGVSRQAPARTRMSALCINKTGLLPPAVKR